ncbi:MAG: hypothetical protein A2Z29_09210 [Chloroflexi bacterium RBG_16_56_11]|nr:MAG: hypothetical protein A2Z29_09210 [Chloroflexi bacterium RBG_16_56_11]
MEERIEFDEITQLSAVAMGEPGKRTFFLIIRQKGKWVRAWLEKELLEALAMATDQFLASIAQERRYFTPETTAEVAPEDVLAGLPSVELEIDQIALGYDQEKATLNFSVHGSGSQKVGWSELYCRVTLAQLKKLGVQARKICAAGRPRCLLCGLPIDPEGHICPKSN